MNIKESGVLIESSVVKMGMDYQTVYSSLKDLIYTKVEPDFSGKGHIIIKRQEFYGLKGTCTLYFQENKLNQISMTPDWSMYNLLDNHGNRMPIDVAIETIATANVKELIKNVGPAIDESQYGNKVFEVEGVYIVSTVARSGEQYSVIIRKA